MNIDATAAVIFEVEPDPQRFDEYLRTAADLKPHLMRMDGFLENERFRSTRHAGRLLSLSLWRDEQALVRWREYAPHRSAQHAGRNGLLSGYRLRVGSITAGVDHGERRREAAMLDECSELVLLESFDASGSPVFDETVEAAAGQARDCEVFTHLQQPERRIALIDDGLPQTLRALAERAAGIDGRATRLLIVHVLRDYGLTDREEAP
jgi:heme-degrading monooxygenase HmoA